MPINISLFIFTYSSIYLIYSGRYYLASISEIGSGRYPSSERYTSFFLSLSLPRAIKSFAVSSYNLFSSSTVTKFLDPICPWSFYANGKLDIGRKPSLLSWSNSDISFTEGPVTPQFILTIVSSIGSLWGFKSTN